MTENVRRAVLGAAGAAPAPGAEPGARRDGAAGWPETSTEAGTRDPADGSAAQRAQSAGEPRPPDREPHPGGADPAVGAVSLAIGVSPATEPGGRDRDLEARKSEGGPYAGDRRAGAVPRAAGLGIGGSLSPVVSLAEVRRTSGAVRPDVVPQPSGTSFAAPPTSAVPWDENHPSRPAPQPPEPSPGGLPLPAVPRDEVPRPPGALDIALEDIDDLVVDCDRCAVRGDACADCVVSVLLGPPVGLVWDADERRAVDALAAAGMVPRLRLVPGTDSKSA